MFQFAPQNSLGIVLGMIDGTWMQMLSLWMESEKREEEWYNTINNRQAQCLSRFSSCVNTIESIARERKMSAPAGKIPRLAWLANVGARKPRCVEWGYASSEWQSSVESLIGKPMALLLPVNSSRNFRKYSLQQQQWASHYYLIIYNSHFTKVGTRAIYTTVGKKEGRTDKSESKPESE